MRILILGANGLVGRAIIRNLKQSGIGEPIAGVRKRSAYFDNLKIESRIAEVTDAASLANSFNGVTHVINCVMGSVASMTEGTRNVVDAAQRAGVQRIVHFSSCVVYGEANGNIDETAPLGGNVNWYGAAKIECENIIGDAVKKGLSVAILRPSCVYGPGSELWSARVGRMLKQRRLGDMGALGDGRCNLVHVDDVAMAAVRALSADLHNGYVFNLSNPNPPRWNEYFMRYACAIDAIPVRRIPGWQIKLDRKLLAPALKIMQIAAGKLRLPVNKIPDPLTPSFLRDIHLDVVYDGQKAASTLGFTYKPLEQGLNQTAGWFLRR